MASFRIAGLLSASFLFVCPQALALSEGVDDVFLYAPAPVALVPSQTLAELNHAFSTKVVENQGIAKDLPEKGFGFRGANVSLGVASMPLPMLVVRAMGHTRGPGALLGVGGVFRSEVVAFEGDVGYFAHREEGKWRNSLVTLASASAPSLRALGVTLSLGAGYDSFEKHWGSSASLGYAIAASHEAFIEYFPRITRSRDNPAIGSHDTFAAGWRWTSGGHEFVLALSNSDAVSAREAMLGAANDSLNFAFRITRVFE